MSKGMEGDERAGCTVCGREAMTEAGLRASYEGRSLCFCSLECQAKFEADPERYAGETPCLAQPPGYW